MRRVSEWLARQVLARERARREALERVLNDGWEYRGAMRWDPADPRLAGWADCAGRSHP